MIGFHSLHELDVDAVISMSYFRQHETHKRMRRHIVPEVKLSLRLKVNGYKQLEQ